MKNAPETLAKRNALRKHWRKVIDPCSFPHAIERICWDCKHMEEHYGLDQASRVALGEPRKHGCMPHAEDGDPDGEVEPEAA